MAKMTNEERLNKDLAEARLLSFQHRWAESKLKYESIIEKLRKEVTSVTPTPTEPLEGAQKEIQRLTEQEKTHG